MYIWIKFLLKKLFSYLLKKKLVKIQLLKEIKFKNDVHKKIK